MIFQHLNQFVFIYIRFIEMIGVLMRIFSFSLVSWMGPESPFMFVWIFNTIDAILLSWCSILKKDNAYTLLNLFWIMVGIVGIARACDCSVATISSFIAPLIQQVVALLR